MQRWNFHTHSTWCDGKNTVQEMADAAYALGFSGLGFSGHGYCPVSQEYCMTPEREAFYRQDVLAQRERYRGRMRIFLGLELEAQDTRIFPPGMYDYLIGSLHYIEEGGVAYPMDDSVETLGRCIREGFGGDAYRLAEAFFARSAMAICARRPDIVGHFDLLARYNGQGRFFDEDSPRYQGIAIEAVREAAKTGAIFEVNSGAMARGIPNRIYPARFLLREIRRLGGQVVLSSDAHRAEHLTFAFPEMEAMLREEGFRTTVYLTEHGWEERPLGG